MTGLEPRPAASTPPPPSRAGWTGRAWAEISGTYAAIVAHPFIRGLASGELPGPAFLYYISQDAHYIREFVKAVSLVGAKAPDAAAARLLTRHAADGLSAESALHEALAADLGAAPGALAGMPASPTTQAYTSYVIAAAVLGDFAEGLAAVLPCLWIYGEVGQMLSRMGSPNAVYQRWIDSYAGAGYAADVAAVLDLADAAAEGLGGPQEARARARFAAAARYEWMFWDAAWRQEAWPL